MENRERLGSRLGFILLSAGCAIGCGNVWKFPWMAGQYGGGGFVLVYALCFYRRRVTVVRIVVANVLVNIFVNAMMGSLWTMMIRGGGYWGWFTVSLSKNLLTIVPKSVVLYFFFQAMLPVLSRVGVLGKERNDLIRPW